MKAHGIHDKATPVRDTPIPSRRKAKTECTGSNKKSKLDQFSEPNGSAADDDEGLARVKGEVESTIIKDEPAVDGELPVASSGLQYQAVEIESAEKVDDDSSIFNDFLHSGSYDQSMLVPQSSCGGVGQSDTGGMASTALSGSGHAMHESILIAD